MDAVVLAPGPKGWFDETAVKDPSVVRFGRKWHVFYTARGGGRYTIGYVAAPTLAGLANAPRHLLTSIRGRSSYGCAPQVFFFKPQKRWFLVYQTDDSNYQPAYSTTTKLDDPLSWSAPLPLTEKDEENKWIDFWTICDDRFAYLFYTRDHRDVMVRKTSLADFPNGWSPAQVAFTGVHEAVHVYRARGRSLRYDMFYELNDGTRSFGLAQATSLEGPWNSVDPKYAVGSALRVGSSGRWTDEVSHGEILRHGFDQRLEYDAAHPKWLIQGVLKDEYREPYPDIPWKLGLIAGN
ncbi:hypothetical protein BH11ARM2_BH11ARM2_07400 [soil metagenome]